jgi:hypothetical protein
MLVRIRELTLEALESRIRGARLYKKSSSGWDRSKIDELIVFDLSKCTNVSLSGAAELLVFLEDACIEGIATQVLFPSANVLQDEVDAWDRRMHEGIDIEAALHREVASRAAARATLERYGFETALDMSHLPVSYRLVRSADSRRATAPMKDLPKNLRRLVGALEDELLRREAAERDFYVPTELRLRWIDDLQRSRLEHLVSDFERVLTQGRESISRPDARSIARTIVYEVLDNVGIHARGRRESEGKPLGAALFGVALLLGNAVDKQIGSSRQLEIVVADSGAGLVTTLNPFFDPQRHDRFLPEPTRQWSAAHKTAMWAFHALSTSRALTQGEPPVRGLSRTRQQLRYQRGSILLRTGDLAVRIVEPSDRSQTEYDQQSNKTLIPGTLFSLLLSAPRPVAAREPSSVRPAASPPVQSLPLSVLLVDNSVDNAEDKLAEAAAGLPDSNAVCLIIPRLDFSADGGQAATVTLARLISLVGGRVTICLLPDQPSGLIFAVLQSFEDLVSPESASARTAPLTPDDPILILGADRKLTWWGPLDRDQAAVILDLASKAGFAVQQNQLESDQSSPRLLQDAPQAVRRLVNEDRLALTSDDLAVALAEWFAESIARRVSVGGPRRNGARCALAKSADGLARP